LMASAIGMQSIPSRPPQASVKTRSGFWSGTFALPSLAIVVAVVFLGRFFLVPSSPSVSLPDGAGKDPGLAVIQSPVNQLSIQHDAAANKSDATRSSEIMPAANEDKISDEPDCKLLKTKLSEDERAKLKARCDAIQKKLVIPAESDERMRDRKR
jgi:hypothetical protein